MTPQATSPATPFEVVCGCGRSVRGERRPRHQVVPCPGCGRALFVLPQGPWDGPSKVGRPIPSALGAWRWPLLAGALSAALVVAGFLVALPYLARSKDSKSNEPAPISSADVLERLAAGQKALGESKFHLALKELDAAIQLRDRNPSLLVPAQHRRLNQLQRQADLLERQSPVSLTTILRRAAAARDLADWKGHFDHTYRGKAVLFRYRLVGLQAGRPALLDRMLRVNDETARVALEDLALLRDLPLDPPVRMLFGARLASAEREAEGEWVVRFQPDSAVLLTDPGAAHACCPGPELDEVVTRQANWLQNVSVLRPALP